jgi:hypothetical protein
MKRGLKQPLLGVLGTAIVLIISLLISAQFNPQNFASWVPLLVLSGLPIQVIIGLQWQGSYPHFLANLAQPVKGGAIISLTVLASVVVAPVINRYVGGDQMPPSPYGVMFVIFSVLNLFWLITTFQGWPMTSLSDHKAVSGVGTWGIMYAFTWVMFETFFDFSSMEGLPFYSAQLDPHGVFPAWVALGFSCTTVLVTMGLVLWDFWPLKSLTRNFDFLQSQPAFGLVSTLFILIVSTVIEYLFRSVLGFEPIEYMVKVAVSGLFGEFIILMLLQTAPFQDVRQPIKGLLLFVVVGCLAFVMEQFYQQMGVLLVGNMSAGAPAYELELWTANAMLGVTFPVIACFADSLGFWPLRVMK